MSGTYQSFQIHRSIRVPVPQTQYLGRNISEVITPDLQPVEPPEENRQYGDLRIKDTFKLSDGTAITRNRWFRKPDDAAPSNTDVSVMKDGKETQFSASATGEIFTETDVRDKDGFKNYKRNERGGLEVWEHGSAVEDPAGFKSMKFVIHQQSGFGGEYVDDFQMNKGEMTRYLSDTDGDNFFDQEKYTFKAERY